MMQRIVLPALLSCALLGNTAAAPRVVQVGIYDNAPKLYIDAQGKPDGILVDMLKEVATKEGWELRFVRCEWTQCLAAAANGSIDLLPDVAWSEERSRLLDFHRVPALFSWSQVYRRVGVDITSMTDTGGKRIAVLSGSIQQRYFADLAMNFGVAPQLVPVASVADGFDLVARGKADAVVASHYVGALHATSRGIVETPIMFQPARLFYVAGKGRNGDLLAALDRSFGAWQADPASVYFDILERWRSRSILAQVPRYVWWGAGLVLALLVMSLSTAAWLKHQNLRKSGALQETEERLETILDSVDSLIYIKDADCRYTYANQALCTFLGRSGEGVMGRRDSDLFEATVDDEIWRNDMRTIAGRQRVVSEETVPDAHGRQVTVLRTKLPLYRADARVHGLCGLSIHISDRRAADEANRVPAPVYQPP